MAEQKIMIDTSVLIDYFRKKNKENTRFIEDFNRFERIYISSITEFEIYTGVKELNREFWESMLSQVTVLDFDGKCARKAAEIVAALKEKRKTLDKPDLFIAATALVYDLPLDTLNTKHFDKVDGLILV